MVKLKINSFITVTYLIIWIISPLLSLANGSFWYEHVTVTEVAAGRTILVAVNAVEIENMEDVSVDTFKFFANSHVNFDAVGDGAHTHISFDACCGAGGLVCDASLVSNVKIVCETQFHNWEDAIDVYLTSVDIPTLRHPPKLNA